MLRYAQPAKSLETYKSVNAGAKQSMRPIPIGAKGVYETLVGEQDLASNFKDATLPPILATPVMIKFMENAALLAVAPYLERSEIALGTVVDVRHLAATPVGKYVSVEAEVVRVDGSRVVYAVRARVDGEDIGTGTHERKIVDGARFMLRLSAKYETHDSSPSDPNTAGS